MKEERLAGGWNAARKVDETETVQNFAVVPFSSLLQCLFFYVSILCTVNEQRLLL